MKKLFQLGNRKLPKSTAIFNLPAGRTCPGSTAFCREVCYAKKAERIYPQVLPFRTACYNETKKSGFVKTAVSELGKLISSGRINAVRIHESGDYYSQEYLEKWIDIAKAFPGTVFYCYTKSNFDFSRAPKNLITRHSVDQSTAGKIPVGIRYRAYTVDTGENPPTGFLKCPGSCKTCSYCLGPGNVYFEKH